MIDTLKLNLTDCTISSHTPLIVEASPYDHSNGQRICDYDLFVDNAGEIVTGKKAYYNSENFNLTIKPKYSLVKDAVDKKLMVNETVISGVTVGDKILNIKIDEEKFNAGIFVQTSLPGYNRKSNYGMLNQLEEKKVLNHLEKDLAGIGIKTNIWNSTLSRVDTFTNIQTDENFYSYANLFEVLEAQRMEKFEFSKTTFLFKNGEKQICIYDKISEMNNKVKDKSVLKVLPINVMRIENRYIRKRKIRSSLSFDNLKVMYKNYDYLKENYRNEIETNIFKYDLPDIETMTGNFIKKDLQYYYSLNKRNWMQLFLKDRGLARVLYESNIETFIEVINEVVEKSDLKNKRMKISRMKRELEEARFRIESRKIALTNKTNAMLYNELKTKFYRLVA